jgi:hypothetical protein
MYTKPLVREYGSLLILQQGKEFCLLLGFFSCACLPFKEKRFIKLRLESKDMFGGHIHFQGQKELFIFLKIGISRKLSLIRSLINRIFFFCSTGA